MSELTEEELAYLAPTDFRTALDRLADRVETDAERADLKKAEEVLLFQRAARRDLTESERFELAALLSSLDDAARRPARKFGWIEIPSSRKGVPPHRVREDGERCTCPGWTNNRKCWHTAQQREIAALLARRAS